VNIVFQPAWLPQCFSSKTRRNNAVKDSCDNFILKRGHKPHLEFQTAVSAKLPTAFQVPFLALQDL